MAAASLLFLLLAAQSAAAAPAPKPIRIATGSLVRVGPVLAGDRVAWWQADELGEIRTATRRARRTVRLPMLRRSIRVDDLDATPKRIAFAGGAERFEIRSDNAEDESFHFGSVGIGTRSEFLGFCEFANGACWWRGVGATLPRGVETSGNAVAWGPFHDGSDDPDRDLLLVKDYTRGSVSVVRAERVGEFKLAGRYLTYTKLGGEGFDSADEIVLVDWRTGREVRSIAPRRVLAFDVDAAGRIGVAQATSNDGTAFAVYDSRGRVRRFSKRSFDRSGDVWLAGGRVAFPRTGSTARRTWEVTTVGGRSIASVRAPSDGELTDFDGHCIAYKRSRKGVYVTRVARAPRGSICR